MQYNELWCYRALFRNISYKPCLVLEMRNILLAMHLWINFIVGNHHLLIVRLTKTDIKWI